MQTTRAREISFEVTTAGTPELVVHGHTGDIHVLGADRGTIGIHADLSDQDLDLNGEPLFVEQSGARVTVDATKNHATLQADLMIRVPIGCVVQVSTVRGDMLVVDTAADIDLTSVDGDIRVEGATGSCKISTVSGDVLAERLRGSLVLQTTSGDVRVRASELDRYNLHSVNGDFSIESPLRTGEHYYARTTNGDLQFLVPAYTGATVQVRGMNGDFHSDLPVDVINRSKRNWQGRINGGGAYLEVETLNGDVKVIASEPSKSTGSQTRQEYVAQIPPLPPEPPLAPVSPYGSGPNVFPHDADRTDDHARSSEATYGRAELHVPSFEAERSTGGTGSASIDVLARLERGELTVEEAMSALDDLR